MPNKLSLLNIAFIYNQFKLKWDYQDKKPSQIKEEM